MAENVQRTLEAMLPELNDLRNRKLFTEAEIRSIVKRRTQFEYAMIRSKPILMDYIRAIKYEINLDKLRRRRKIRLNQTRVAGTVSDFAIVRRIHNIFRRAIYRFKNDLDLWIQYIEWSIAAGSSRRLGQLFVEALQVHPLVPWLWCRAANYQFEVQGTIDTARILFQRGLRINPTSTLLWHEFFKMEMRFIGINIARKAALGLIPTRWVLDITRKHEAGIPLTELGVSETDMRRIPESVQQFEETLDIPAKKLLSGVLPITIYNNAILNDKLKDDLQFRLGFLSLVDSWTNSEESEKTKKQFKDRPLKSSTIAVVHHHSLTPLPRDQVVDVDCLEAAGVHIQSIAETIMLTIARDFSTPESYLIRARAVRRHEDYIDPVLVKLYEKLQKDVEEGTTSRKRLKRESGSKGSKDTFVCERILPLTLAFTGLTRTPESNLAQDFMHALENREVRAFALMETMLRKESSSPGPRAVAYYTFAKYLLEQAADTENDSQRYLASFFRLMNLSLGNVVFPNAEPPKPGFTLALGKLWIEALRAQLVDLKEELFIKDSSKALTSFISNFSEASVSQFLDANLDEELEELVNSDSDSDSDSDSNSDSGSDSDEMTSQSHKTQHQKTNPAAQQAFVLTLSDVLLTCMKHSIKLRRRIDEGDLAPALAQEFETENSDQRLSEGDRLDIKSLTPFWLEVIELYQIAYQSSLLDSILGASDLTETAWKQLLLVHEVALQAVPVQDALKIFDKRLALNDILATFASAGHADETAVLQSTEQIYIRALKYFREASNARDALTVTKSVVLNDFTAPPDVHHVRLASGIAQAAASREALGAVKTRFLEWALAVAASCTDTATEVGSTSERLTFAAGLLKRVVENCLVTDDVFKPTLDAVVTGFQTELQVHRILQLEISKRRASYIKQKLSPQRLKDLLQEEKELAHETTRRIKTLFEKAVVHYGSKKPKLWIEYIRCFVPSTSRNAKLAESTSSISEDEQNEFIATQLADLDEITRTYSRATRTLVPALRQEFVTEYEKLMERHE